MCIYFNEKSLTYSNQEHVFPAGLGGIAKLPNGTVSDKANELFSPMERKLMRDSILSLFRNMYGPGKRNSLSPNNATKSNISIGKDDESEIFLSYISLGKPFTIPQFRITGDTVRFRFLGEKIDMEALRKFRKELLLFSGKYTYLKCEELGTDNDTIVGIMDKKFYISTHGNELAKEEIVLLIDKAIDDINRNIAGAQCISNLSCSQVTQTRRIVESQEVSRMYAKTAMNVLAYIKGDKIAMHNNFDVIRKWIVSGESQIPQLHFPSFNEDLSRIFPANEHWCMIANLDHRLLATVCFYGKIIESFDMGDIPEGLTEFPFGFICDWANHNEMSLSDFLIKIGNQQC